MDLQLSELARRKFPYAVECKSLKRCAVYKHYEQACDNAEGLQPMLVLKANRQRELAIIDADYLLELLLQPYNHFR